MLTALVLLVLLPAVCAAIALRISDRCRPTPYRHDRRWMEALWAVALYRPPRGVAVEMSVEPDGSVVVTLRSGKGFLDWRIWPDNPPSVEDVNLRLDRLGSLVLPGPIEATLAEAWDRFEHSISQQGRN